jgi:hypothetical protein
MERLSGSKVGGGSMIKILAAIVGGALLAGTIVLLPGMTTIDPAATALAYGNADVQPLAASAPLVSRFANGRRLSGVAGSRIRALKQRPRTVTPANSRGTMTRSHGSSSMPA